MARTLEQRFYECRDYINSNRLSQLDKLIKIYEFCDSYGGENFSQKALCKSGCSYCCKIPVSVSEIEAVLIADKTGRQIVKNINHENTETECPFLLDNKCSIYAYRPFACRTYWELESTDYCKNIDLPHNITNAMGTVLEQFIYVIDALSKTKGANDIRYYFPRVVF